MIFGNDIFETLTGKQMYRTTVNHEDGDGSMAPSDVIGRAVTEMPAISSGLDPIYYGATSSYHGLTSQLTKEDVRGLMKWVPLNSWLGLTLASSMIDTDDLPTRKEVDAQEEQEEQYDEALAQQPSDENMSASSHASALDKIMNVR